MSLLHLLLWVLAAAAVLSLAAAVAIWKIRRESVWWSDTSIGIATQIIASVPGASIALAAAIATVSVSNLALNITERRAAQEQLDSIHRIYAELSIAISNLVRAGHGVLWVYHRERGQLSGADMSQALESRVTNLRAALSKLDDALHALQLSFPAKKLLKLEEEVSALYYLSSNAAEETHWVREFFPIDIGSLRLFVHDSGQSITARPRLEIERAYCITLLDRSLGSGHNQELNPLHWVVFTGHLLGVVTETSGSHGPPNSSLEISLGLGMLHDLYFAIPNGEDIVADVSSTLSKVREAGAGFRFDRDDTMGKRFVEGMTLLHSRFDLLLMTSPGDYAASSCP